MSNMDKKQLAAKTALEQIPHEGVIGIGSGSTVNEFIKQLATIKHKLEGVVAASQASAEQLKALHIPVFDLNSCQIEYYVDGADQIDPHGRMIKGAGAAMTLEKIIAASAKHIIIMVDDSKLQPTLNNTTPIPIEVIPAARSLVGRHIVKLGGDPVYRQGTTTDQQNLMIDAFNLPLTDPTKLDIAINQIPGVVGHGLFSQQIANTIIIGHDDHCDIKKT